MEEKATSRAVSYVGIKDNKIVDFDIFEALKMTKTIDMKDYELAHEISI